MKLSEVMIGLLLVGAMFTGIYTFINDLADSDSYNVADVTDYSSSFDRTTNISTQISSDYKKVFGDDDNSQDVWYVPGSSYIDLVPSAVSLVKNMIKLPFAVIGELFHSITYELGLPAWVEAFLIAAALSMMLFALIALVLRYRDT